jgi:hypothetical protein
VRKPFDGQFKKHDKSEKVLFAFKTPKNLSLAPSRK